MSITGIKADGLRFRTSAGLEVARLLSVGTIPGVEITYVADLNGPGIARIQSHEDGTKLSWRAPGSGSAGLQVSCATDGEYLLEDGDDPNKWVRVNVNVNYLSANPTWATVRLADRYQQIDVTAAGAAAGVTNVFTMQIKNQSSMDAKDVRAYLDPTTQWIELSKDGTTYYRPTSATHPEVLAWGTLASGATTPLYVRRTIPAGQRYTPAELFLIHTAWAGY